MAISVPISLLLIVYFSNVKLDFLKAVIIILEVGFYLILVPFCLYWSLKLFVSGVKMDTGSTDEHMEAENHSKFLLISYMICLSVSFLLIFVTLALLVLPCLMIFIIHKIQTDRDERWDDSSFDDNFEEEERQRQTLMDERKEYIESKKKLGKDLHTDIDYECSICF